MTLAHAYDTDAPPPPELEDDGPPPPEEGESDDALPRPAVADSAAVPGAGREQAPAAGPVHVGELVGPQERAELIADELNEEARGVLARAQVYVCVTPDDYARAADLAEELKAMEAVIDRRLGPIIDDAHKTHRGLTALRAELKDPIITRYKAVMRAAADWREAQEKAEREEAARLAREQQAAELARAEREAKQLEAAGDTQAALEVRQEAKHAPPPAVHVETAVPKVKSASGGGMVARDEWDYEITDEKALPDEYWVVDKPSIAAVVKRQKDACRIPGIRVFKTAATSFRRGK